MGKKKIYEEDMIRICNESNTMGIAFAKYTEKFGNINKQTFIKYAKELNCYSPNQGSKGSKKPKENIWSTEDILSGLVPQYQTFKLKLRLIKEKLIEEKCNICNLVEWNNEKIPLELDHIDGNNTNHKKENIRLICPNCHAQTPTYRAKNIKNNKLI